jgi:hypothetical protein
MSITQEESISLFEMRKIPVKELSCTFPEAGSKMEIELCSEDRRFNFQADINRKGNKTPKLIYQHRTGKIYILRRLDFIGAPHKNPPEMIDDELMSKFVNADIPSPHLHIYMEGYNDRWAVPLSEISQVNIIAQDDAFTVMEKFFEYCNIELPDFKQIGLFTL